MDQWLPGHAGPPSAVIVPPPAPGGRQELGTITAAASGVHPRRPITHPGFLLPRRCQRHGGLGHRPNSPIRSTAAVTESGSFSIHTRGRARWLCPSRNNRSPTIPASN
jgi:hypothetical protein